MRRLLAVTVLCSSLVLTAAAPQPAPSPSASPAPAATFQEAPAKATEPSVVVYPFDIGGDIPKNAGTEIQGILEAELNQAGGLLVMTPSTGTQRSDYLKQANAMHADYYLSGFLTAVGQGAAMVTQLVSTTSGAMIWTNTVEITSAQDAAAQGQIARQYMLAHSGLLDAPAGDVAAESTPAPSSDKGASVNVKGFGNLFGLIKHGQSAPQATPVPLAERPSRMAIVARVVGSGFSGGELTIATQSLHGALDRAFKTRLGDVDTNGIAARANGVCGSDRDATIVGGTLSKHHVGGFRAHTDVTFAMRVYTCFGAVLYDGTATARSAGDAIRSAVAAYAKDHPGNS